MDRFELVTPAAASAAAAEALAAAEAVATDLAALAARSVTKVKAAAESVLNSTALQNDDDLTFPIAANETWVVEWALYCDGSTTGDFRGAVAAPAGAAGIVSMIGQAQNATTAFGAILNQAGALGAALGAGMVGAGTTLPIVVRASVVNGATPGTVALQWAQNGLDAVVPTRVLALSAMVARRQ